MLFKNKILLLFLVCSIQFNDNWICNAQTNLIGNGSFEKPHPSQDKDKVPWTFAQIYQKNANPFIADDKYMLHWETRQRKVFIENKTKYKWIHSPEWFKKLYLRYVMDEILTDENGNSSSFYVSAKSGRGYIGMMDAELVQQKLEIDDLIEGDDYTISLVFRTVNAIAIGGKYYPQFPDWDGEGTLKVWIAKDKIRYKHNTFNSHCEPDDDHFTTPNVDKIEILNKQINIDDYPPGQWNQIISTFTAPILGFLEEKYKWFIIELIGNDNFGPCNSYVLIDDVALNKECCIVECSRTDRCMNPVIGTEHKAELDGWWFVDNLDNVTQAEIEIFDISGPKIKTYSVSSINGITEPIYWDGTDFNGNEQSPSPSAYPYSITLTNDCGTEEWEGGIFKSVLGATPPPPVTVYNNNGIITPEPCCAEQPDIYIDSQTLSGPGVLEFVAINNIYIATNGPVTISNNANVLFQAGNEIIVGTYDYNEELGAEISKVIVSCPPNPNGKKGDDEGNDYVTETINEEEPETDEIEETSGFSIHPNPSNGEFIITVQGSGFNVQSFVYIYNILGELVYQSSIFNNQSTIDIVQHPKGIYLVKVFQGEQVYIKKLIHQ